MLISYARISAEDQNLDLQLDAPKAAYCEQLCTDQASGAAKVPPGLDDAMRYLRAGDAMVIWKLDRDGLAGEWSERATIKSSIVVNRSSVDSRKLGIQAIEIISIQCPDSSSRAHQRNKQ